MFRLKKNGVIREVESKEAADRYLSKGYDLEEELEAEPEKKKNKKEKDPEG